MRGALFDRLVERFDEALAHAQRALALSPQQIWIATNRAHALMFLGRADEARAVYLEHRGKPIPEQGNKPWEQVILEDFTALREAGLDHPQMKEIEGALAGEMLKPQ